jgi:hypothetical protein
MEGGRTIGVTEVAKVIEDERDEKISDVYTPIPKEVDTFRKIINQYKRVMTESLEKENATNDIQDIRLVSSLINRIQHLGNILILILEVNPESYPPESIEHIEQILDTFKSRGFTFDNLDDETRKLCSYYVKNDIHMYPFDLNHHSEKTATK